LELIDCRNQFLEKLPDDFSVNDKTYTEYLNLQGNLIERMELNLPEWKSLRLINLMENPVNCRWLDRQDWKILVRSRCKLTVDKPWQAEWISQSQRKKEDDTLEPYDSYEDDDDEYYDDYYYDDDNRVKPKRAKKSNRFGAPPTPGIIAVAVIVTIVGLIVIVVGILFFMKRSREAGQRRRLDNIMSATDDE